MAYQQRKMREKREQEMRYCNCIVAIFQVMVACQSITFISGQGYLYPSTGFQSQRVLQGVSLFPRQQAQGVTTEKHDKKMYSVSHSTSQIRIIRFEPPFLDFDAECVGMPKMRTVYIHNPSKDRDLQLSSISARTSHFHSSFFENKIVPPGGNTSFEVVFLARVIGNVENTLFINTVRGTFPYQVFGVGIPNPYRLRPYLGARVPVNSSFSPLISMHNPTSQPLQVTEMYSSSGYLQLQLPSGEHEVGKDQWEIPPFETKQVMRARFLGQVEANHTAFIRIKTAQTESSAFHILPVEVEVSSAPGIYSSIELLDFGTIRTQYDDPKTLPLFLLNSGSREVVISSITLSSPNPAISIDFKPLKLRPSDTTFTRVANITFAGPLAKSEEHQMGSITVKTKEKSYSTVEIPFIANLLDGTLGYDEETTLFNQHDVKSDSAVVREITLSNMFPFPVILQNVTLTPEASEHFKILNFDDPITLPPYAQLAPFSIQFTPEGARGKKDKAGNEGGSIYYLMLQTNASKFSLPLHTYSGILSYKVLREDPKKIDFGIMGTMDKRQVLFALYNRNPTPVTLLSINTSLSSTQIRLVSLTQGSEKNLTEEVNFKTENFELPTNSCSVLEVTLSASETEENIIGAVNILTKYQEIRIPILARVVVGALTVKPERMKLPPSFPGLIVSHAVTITNTFAQVTTLDSVRFKQGDKRFYYRKTKNQASSLEPNKKVKVGRVFFDARQICKPDRCYVGLPTSTTVGHHWLLTLALGPDSVEFDTKRYKELRQRWKNLESKGLTGPNTTLALDTNVVMNVEVPVQAKLIWPTLLEESSFHFPLTHVGRKSVAVLELYNPSDSPVIVQILPVSLYPQPATALEALGWSEMANDESFIINNSSVFHLQDPRFEQGRDSMTSQMVWLEYTLNGKLNHSVVNLFLDPGSKATLKVEFMPYDDLPKSTVILLRNNLTILDSLVMHGRGAHEHLTLGGKSPNLPNSVLRFKIAKDILKDCTRKKKKSNPNFTVRKWFHANNTGLLPIHITSITVNGSPCEGYGFRVLDCDQFILHPNSSKKLEIAFTPDFTSYLVLHQLKLITAQGNEMVFILNVTLPPYMLPLCQEAVPRPSWEPALYHFISLVMLVLFAGVLLMAYLEAINIWEPFVRLYEVELQHREHAVDGSKKLENQAAPEGFGKRFDLRSIATSFISTVTSPRAKSEASKNIISPSKRKRQSVMTSTSIDYPTVVYSARNKKDHSQQTDPHPDFPPLTRWKPAKIPVFQNDSRNLEKSNANIEKQKTSPVPQTQPSFRQRTIDRAKSNNVSMKQKDIPIKVLATTDRKTESGTPVLSEISSEELPPDIKPFAEILANYRPPTDDSKRGVKDSMKEAKKSVKNDQKSASDKKVQHESKAEKVENVSKVDETRKQNESEVPRSQSNSNRQARISTSSSSSADPVDVETSDTKPAREKCPEKGVKKEKSPEKVENEIKPVRGKKLRKTKMTRKQLKAALMKEKENSKAEAAKEKEKSSTPSEEEKPLPETNESIGRKQPRQTKRAAKQRSLSTSSEMTPLKNEGKTTDKAEGKTTVAIKKQGSKTGKRSPEVAQSSTPEVQRNPSPKRRSNSYSYENLKGKDKAPKFKQYTIYKNPRMSDSGSSSPHESSSSESAPLWDTPSQTRGQTDPNEEMMQLAKQTQQADLFMEEKRKQGRRRDRGGPSPINLTSSSRSSSYSSMASSASSSEGIPTKISTNGTTGTPTKKLSRSASDTSGGGVTKPQLRKRNPYSSVSHDVSISPTHTRTSPTKETPFVPSSQNMGRNSSRTPPGATPNNRTLSSPSMFSSVFAKGKQDDLAQDATQWPGQNQALTSSYSAFGHSSYNFMENLIGVSSSTRNCPMNPTWSSPFSDSSSLYSSPSPQRNPDNVPHHQSQNSMRPRNWSSNGSPLHTPTGYPTFDAPPGTPTTPGLPQQPSGLGWGELPSPTSGNMSTHSIWSVSNAVTMDENRNADECDLLGLKSIWSNPSNMRNPNWHDHH